MEVKVRFTESLVRKSTLRFLSRLVGREGSLAISACAVGLVFLLTHGPGTMFDGVLVGVGALVLILFPSIYFLTLRSRLVAFRKMASPDVSFVFDEEGIFSRSDLGSSRVPWQTLQKIWMFPEVWLLFVGKGQFMTLPVEQLDESLRQFVLQRAASAGVKISG